MVFHRYYCSINKGHFNDYTICKKKYPGNFTSQAELLAKIKQCFTYFSLLIALTVHFFAHMPLSS